jgi:hypothetical protein
MAFRKKHKLGFTSDDPLDKIPLSIKLRIGVREKVKAVPDWQAKLRDLLEEWLAQNQNQ